MGKRYKEFLIDILTKAYQIFLAVVIVTPIVTRNVTPQLFIGGSCIVILFLVWAGAISVRLEE